MKKSIRLSFSFISKDFLVTLLGIYNPILTSNPQRLARFNEIEKLQLRNPYIDMYKNSRPANADYLNDAQMSEDLGSTNDITFGISIFH